MRSMMLLVNPNAGKGGYKTELGGILKTFSDGDILPSVYFSRAPGEIPKLVEAHAAEYDMVSCLGGDGTLSEVCAGLMRAPERRPIGYIPLGTANDVAHTLGLSPRPSDAAKDILIGAPAPYDIGQFGERDFFTYVAAFGAFTEVSYATPQENKQVLGHLAYMLEALRQLPKLTDHHAVVEYDGGTLEGDFIFGAVTNSTSVGGLVKLDNEMVGLADGAFEMLLVRKPQDILDLGDIISSALSLDFSGPFVSFIKSSQVRFRFDGPVAWTRDGEDGGTHSEVLIRNRHPGVEIIV
ncbi:MAG: YegS/Rv2252/BmrU family lipid kinase [Oscillospiraceae bacterium]|nr:YegS/Rv2252/BmrU family lipid kinase [Oscillospiraceae bacterium]